jgi:DME family drug/metabolite transporter
MAGILLRWVESADGWQILFYRSAVFSLVLLGFLAWRHGGGLSRAFVAVGRPGVVVALFLGVAFIGYILALLATTVANAVFIVSASPLVTAVLAWLVLREPVTPALWLAIVVTLAGLAFMFGDGIVTGSLLGASLALMACFCYATALVAMRGGRNVDMLPAVCLAGAVATLLSASQVPSFTISLHDLAIATLLGAVQLGLQYILLTEGSRHLPAAEIALLGRLSVVLAPIWVWLGVGETPSTLTLIGGAIVVTTVIIHSAAGLRHQPPAKPQTD